MIKLGSKGRDFRGIVRCSPSNSHFFWSPTTCHSTCKKFSNLFKTLTSLKGSRIRIKTCSPIGLKMRYFWVEFCGRGQSEFPVLLHVGKNRTHSCNTYGIVVNVSHPSISLSWTYLVLSSVSSRLWNCPVLFLCHGWGWLVATCGSDQAEHCCQKHQPVKQPKHHGQKKHL